MWQERVKPGTAGRKPVHLASRLPGAERLECAAVPLDPSTLAAILCLVTLGAALQGCLLNTTDAADE